MPHSLHHVLFAGSTGKCTSPRAASKLLQYAVAFYSATPAWDVGATPEWFARVSVVLFTLLATLAFHADVALPRGKHLLAAARRGLFKCFGRGPAVTAAFVDAVLALPPGRPAVAGATFLLRYLAAATPTALADDGTLRRRFVDHFLRCLVDPTCSSSDACDGAVAAAAFDVLLTSVSHDEMAAVVLPVLQRAFKAKTVQGLIIGALLLQHCTLDVSRYVDAAFLPVVLSSVASQKDEVRAVVPAFVEADIRRCRFVCCGPAVGCACRCVRVCVGAAWVCVRAWFPRFYAFSLNRASRWRGRRLPSRHTVTHCYSNTQQRVAWIGALNARMSSQSWRATVIVAWGFVVSHSAFFCSDCSILSMPPPVGTAVQQRFINTPVPHCRSCSFLTCFPLIQ